MSEKFCQLQSWSRIHDPIRHSQRFWQRRNRVKRIYKRRRNYLRKWFFDLFRGEKGETNLRGNPTVIGSLKPGDMVRIRSANEIKATLDRWNQTGRCAFMEEMWDYCGSTQRVLKRVEKFLDERDYLVKKCTGIILLDGVYCHGTVDFGECDRTCFIFWREEWLEKVDTP
jgi:hypothetical protein